MTNEDYLRKAAEADRAALNARDPMLRSEWAALAEQWRRLASLNLDDRGPSTFDIA